MTPVQLGLFRPNTSMSGELELLPINVTPEKIDYTTSLIAALSAFHEHMRQQGFSANTIKAFGGDLNMFCRYFGPNKAVGEVTTEDLTRFMDYLRYGRGVPCSTKSYQRRLTSLKVFFNFLFEQRAMQADPAAPIMHQPAITPMPEILTPEEAEHLLATTRDLLTALRPDTRPHLLISMILTTGVKKSEIMSLKLKDIVNAKSEMPYVFVHYDDPRRWHKQRKLKLPEDFATTYAQYLEQYQPHERVFECTPRNLEYVLTDAARLSDLEGRITFETLRWTSAVHDLASGMPEEKLRQKMGLSEISWSEVGDKIKRLAAKPL